MPTKSNDPKGERHAGAARAPALSAPIAAAPALAELRARLALLREYNVASYQRDADGKETINLFPSAGRPPTEGELAKDEQEREESQARFERRMKFGASGGMRGPE